jgi:hypothetical protein
MMLGGYLHGRRRRAHRRFRSLVAAWKHIASEMDNAILGLDSDSVFPFEVGD